MPRIAMTTLTTILTVGIVVVGTCDGTVVVAVDAAKAKGQLSVGLPKQRLQRALVKMHASRFLALPDSLKRGFKAQAALLQEKKAEAVALDLEHARGALELHMSRGLVAAQAEGRPRMVLSSCKLSKDDV